MVLGANGEFTRGELLGPMDFDQWSACYKVFRTACIMLDLICPSALDEYSDWIFRYSSRFGAECWPLLYQAETRARRELSDRIRRRAASDHMAMAMSARLQGVLFQHAYDPDKPWSCVWAMLTKDMEFWKLQFEDVAYMLKAKVQSLGSMPLTGEVPVASTPSANIAAHCALQLGNGGGSTTPHGGGGGQVKKKGKVTQNIDKAWRSNPDGTWSHNRQNQPLCWDYQTGKCTGTKCGRGRAHQCHNCLGQHPANECDPSKVGTGKKSKKGKGKGKSKKE